MCKVHAKSYCPAHRCMSCEQIHCFCLFLPRQEGVTCSFEYRTDGKITCKSATLFRVYATRCPQRRRSDWAFGHVPARRRFAANGQNNNNASCDCCGLRAQRDAIAWLRVCDVMGGLGGVRADGADKAFTLRLLEDKGQTPGKNNGVDGKSARVG